MITQQQYRRLMKEYQKTGNKTMAALRAGMHRETAGKYVLRGQGPQREKGRSRRRADPLERLWPRAEVYLRDAPEIEAKLLFEHLQEQDPDAQAQLALRTFQRRVRQWRRQHGPPREVSFAQVHKPGEVIELDWTRIGDLGVTIGGEPAPGLLCHCVLPYSNWEHASPCQSESALSLRSGLQEALWSLGGVPQAVRTDHSSTATHTLRKGRRGRGFNDDYRSFCTHLGIDPRTINPGRPQENGDIESSHAQLKRRLRTLLAIRGTRDFADIEGWAAFVSAACARANTLRTERLKEELPCLRALPAERFPQAHTLRLRVSAGSTVRVGHAVYSVPARLIGAFVDVEIDERTLTVRFEEEAVLHCPRLTGSQARIDYRHILPSLLRKPGALARYVYRDELFPRPVFRQAYDRLREAEPADADRTYVQLLVLASGQGEDRLATSLGACLREGRVPRPEALDLDRSTPTVPALPVLVPQLASYDTLITEQTA